MNSGKRTIIPIGTHSLKPAGRINMKNNNLVMNTLDEIPDAKNNAKRITGLIKKGGRVTGYQLSDNTVVSEQNAVDMAKQGQIAGVGIAHRGDTEYLKSIPNGTENDNLGNLPPVSPQSESAKRIQKKTTSEQPS